MNIKIKKTDTLPYEMRGRKATVTGLHRMWGEGEILIVVKMKGDRPKWGRRFVSLSDIEDPPDELKNEIMLNYLK